MDRDRFVSAGTDRWRRLEGLLASPPRTSEGWTELSRLYRSTTADLSRARTADLPPDVVAYLDDIAGRAHNALYGGRARRFPDLLRIVLVEFPRELRAQAGFFWMASLLFFGPFVLCGLGAFASAEVASAVLPVEQLSMVEAMYADAVERDTSQDASMAGFYVYNNVGIAFRCFATGALAGLGTLYTLVYNGIVLGTIFGHLFRVGLGHNLLSFTAGHTAWELVGVVVAGTAGLKLGWALLVTEGRTVMGSLRAAGPSLFRLVVGAAAMIGMAALIEGFWSAGPMPLPVKLVFGGLQGLLVVVWLARGGRGDV